MAGQTVRNDAFPSELIVSPRTTLSLLRAPTPTVIPRRANLTRGVAGGFLTRIVVPRPTRRRGRPPARAVIAGGAVGALGLRAQAAAAAVRAGGAVGALGLRAQASAVAEGALGAVGALARRREAGSRGVLPSDAVLAHSLRVGARVSVVRAGGTGRTYSEACL